MTKQMILIPALTVLFLATGPVLAQFADDAQTLFPEIPKADQYETNKDNLVIWEFDTKAEDEEGDPAAQSVEEICCGLDDAQRANQAICIDVDYTCDR